MVNETETPVVEPAVETAVETTETTQESDKTRDEKGQFSKPPDVRIAEITRKHREQERETQYWRQRAESQAKVEAPKAEKPTPDKFDDYGAYVEALADWKANEIVDKKLSASEKAAEQRRQNNDRDAKYHERLAKTREGITDYDEVLSAAADMPVTDHVSDLIKESELGAKLLYHFAKNPDVLDRLNSMSERAAAREIGRIEAGIESQPKEIDPEAVAAEAARPKKTTAAPAPAKPIGSGRATSVNLANASMDEFKAARKQQGARWAR